MLFQKLVWLGVLALASLIIQGCQSSESRQGLLAAMEAGVAGAGSSMNGQPGYSQPQPFIYQPPQIQQSQSFAPNGAIQTKIDGDFEGWTGSTIWKMQNGQIWQQSQYAYHYHYAYMPNVVIFHLGNGWRMVVEGDETQVSVQRIH